MPTAAGLQLPGKHTCRNTTRYTRYRPLQQRLRSRLTLCQRAAAVDASQTQLPPLVPLDDEFEQRHAFSASANWIVPGYVMLGRYPFVEPSRLRSREAGEANLERIIGAGITTFVALQAEVAPQEEVPARGQDGFMPYKATADLIAAAHSGAPPSEVVEGLRNPYLDKYVPPRRREASESYQSYRLLRPQYVRMPIRDLSVPAEDTLADFLDDLSGRLSAGEKLYVHCWGGRGRSGLVGAALLARLYGVSADEALQRVQRAFDCRQALGGEANRVPETDEQHEFVRTMCSRFAK